MRKNQVIIIILMDSAEIITILTKKLTSTETECSPIKLQPTTMTEHATNAQPKNNN